MGCPFRGFGSAALDVEFVESVLVEHGPDFGVVVASVEAEGPDVGEGSVLSSTA